MSKAVFLLTFDTELHWALRGREWRTEDVSALAHLRHTGLAALLDLLDEFQVPATFAVVGHLLATPEEVEVPRAVSDALCGAGSDGAWYSSLRADFERQEDGLYWPELPAFFAARKMTHEIGAHSLTHCVFDERSLPELVARFEVSTAQRLIEEAFGVQPKSFIFPRNHVGHLAVLGALGTEAFRGLDQTWWHRAPGAGAKIAHLADRVLALQPPVYAGPCETAGVINVPGSMLLLSPSGGRRHIPMYCRYRQAARGIRAAVRSAGMFHLWMHPIDLAYGQGALLPVLRGILELMASAVGDGRAEFRTMGTVQQACRR